MSAAFRISVAISGGNVARTDRAAGPAPAAVPATAAAAPRAGPGPRDVAFRRFLPGGGAESSHSSRASSSRVHGAGRVGGAVPLRRSRSSTRPALRRASGSILPDHLQAPRRATLPQPRARAGSAASSLRPEAAPGGPARVPILPRRPPGPAAARMTPAPPTRTGAIGCAALLPRAAGWSGGRAIPASWAGRPVASSPSRPRPGLRCLGRPPEDAFRTVPAAAAPGRGRRSPARSTVRCAGAASPRAGSVRPGLRGVPPDRRTHARGRFAGRSIHCPHADPPAPPDRAGGAGPRRAAGARRFGREDSGAPDESTGVRAISGRPVARRTRS